MELELRQQKRTDQHVQTCFACDTNGQPSYHTVLAHDHYQYSMDSSLESQR